MFYSAHENMKKKNSKVAYFSKLSEIFSTACLEWTIPSLTYYKNLHIHRKNHLAATNGPIHACYCKISSWLFHFASQYIISYSKAASSNTPCFHAHADFFRLVMKGIFLSLCLWPFDFLIKNSQQNNICMTRCHWLRPWRCSIRPKTAKVQYSFVCL